MANKRAHVSVALFLLVTAPPCVLASPVPRVAASDIGALSFAELTQRTIRRILELGFLRGILSSLLILGCLVGLLIGVLAAIARHFRAQDVKSWHNPERQRTRYTREKDGVLSMCGQRPARGGPRHLRTAPQTRVSRYLLSRRPLSITTVNIRASSSPKRASSPPSPPSHRPTRSSSPPLRSALSKSPPATRFSTAQTLLFGRRPSSPSSSPKSVRWADELAVSIIATVDLSLRHADQPPEFDLGTSKLSALLEQPFSTSPALDYTPAKKLVFEGQAY